MFEEVIDRPDGRTTRSRGVLSPTATDAELVRRLAYGLVSVAE